jgi:hypothetical protein
VQEKAEQDPQEPMYHEYVTSRERREEKRREGSGREQRGEKKREETE